MWRRAEIILLGILLLVILSVLWGAIPVPHALWAYSLLLLTGFYVIITGSNHFVEGAANIGYDLKISQHVVGLTIVAFATSLPELCFSALSALQGYGEASWGNIAGSNIFNITLVLGVAALIMPLRQSRNSWIDASIYVLVAVLLVVFTLTGGTVERWEGLVFLAGYALYLRYLWGREEEVEEVESGIPLLTSILLTVLGAGAVILGSQALITAMVGISLILQISPLIISATVIAVGTSLPELATSVAAAWKKNYGIAVGNVIGSNIINILVVVGLAASITPLSVGVEEKATLSIGFMFLTGVIAILISRVRIRKWHGAVLIGLYVLFLALLFS